MRGRPRRAADSAFCRAWRAIRDAGRQGINASRVLDHLRASNRSHVYGALRMLSLEGFVERSTGAVPIYRVSEDCKVPSGQDPALGPGWDEEGEPDEPEFVLAAPPANAEEPATPGPEGVPHPVTSPQLESLLCSLNSNGELFIQSASGQDINLPLEETRKLLHYLDRVAMPEAAS